MTPTSLSYPFIINKTALFIPGFAIQLYPSLSKRSKLIHRSSTSPDYFTALASSIGTANSSLLSIKIGISTSLGEMDLSYQVLPSTDALKSWFLTNSGVAAGNSGSELFAAILPSRCVAAATAVSEQSLHAKMALVCDLLIRLTAGGPGMVCALGAFGTESFGAERACADGSGF